MSEGIIGFMIGCLAGVLLGLLLAVATHDLRPMNYLDGQALMHLVDSLEPTDHANMSVDLTEALGDNGNISHYEFECLLRDAARLKYGP